MINAFLLIGQSNMAGRGVMGEVEPIENSRILMLKNGMWSAAREPLHSDRPEIAGIGLGMSFANTLHQKYRKDIGLIPCAFGGSRLDEWEKGGKHYENALKETKLALRSSKLKGILWHQGESDSDTLEKAGSYKERFLPFINSLMQDIGVTGMPVILGELGEFLAEHEKYKHYYSLVNRQLSDIVAEDKCFSLVSSAGLNDKRDDLHFDSVSLREFGVRYAKAWEGCAGAVGTNLE